MDRQVEMNSRGGILVSVNDVWMGGWMDELMN